MTPLDLLLTPILDIILRIATSELTRSLFDGQIRYDELLIWLADRKKRPKNALTKKEIRGLIVGVDGTVITGKIKNRFIELIAKKGLISQLNEKEFKKHRKEALLSSATAAKLKIEWIDLFLAVNPLLENSVVDTLNDIYDKEKVACIAILPFPRNNKARLTAAIERALKGCLATQGVPADFLMPAVLREHPRAQWLIKTKDTEKILIIQPVGINDEYLQKSVDYIHKHSDSQIAEILTIIKLSDQAVGQKGPNVPQRILVELGLKCSEGDIENANN